MVTSREVIDLAVSLLDAVDDLEFPADPVPGPAPQRLPGPDELLDAPVGETGAGPVAAGASSAVQPTDPVRSARTFGPSREDAGITGGDVDALLTGRFPGALGPPTTQEVADGWLAWHAGGYRAFGPESPGRFDAAELGVRGGPNLVAGCLARDGTDLGLATLDLLGEVQPLLAAIERHLRRMRQWRASRAVAVQPLGPSAPSAGLTCREAEALTLLSEGLTAAAAARRMGCSISMVNKHLGSVYRKLGVGDRLDAVLEAQRRGLLGGPERSHADTGGGQGANPSPDPLGATGR